jgi:hypothetical protein
MLRRILAGLSLSTDAPRQDAGSRLLEEMEIEALPPEVRTP